MRGDVWGWGQEFLGVGWLYLQLVVGTVYLLVVIDFKRLQELEVEGVAPLYSDTVVAAQVGGVRLGVLQAGDVARGLREQLAAALGWESRARAGHPESPTLLSPCLPWDHPGRTSPWQERPSCWSS